MKESESKRLEAEDLAAMEATSNITMEKVEEDGDTGADTGVDDADMNIFELMEEEEAKAEEDILPSI